MYLFFFFHAEDGIRDYKVTGVQTCALPIFNRDLDLIRQHLSRSRPRITELPGSLVPFELLFQVTMLGGAREDARIARSEERRVGKECRSRWSAHKSKNKHSTIAQIVSDTRL